MGSLHTQEFAEAVARNELQLRTAVMYQLRYNHYPPIPSSMIDPCIIAINAGNDGDFDKIIDLPDGISYRGKDKVYVSGKKVDEQGNPCYAKARQIIGAHHLDEFITYYDDEWED